MYPSPAKENRSEHNKRINQKQPNTRYHTICLHRSGDTGMGILCLCDHLPYGAVMNTVHIIASREFIHHQLTQYAGLEATSIDAIVDGAKFQTNVKGDQDPFRFTVSQCDRGLSLECTFGKYGSYSAISFLNRIGGVLLMQCNIRY